jgi:hypothetical protein
VGDTKSAERQKHMATLINTAMDAMTKDQQLEFFAKCVMEEPLCDVKAQRDAFEAHIADHAAEIHESDKSDIEEARRIYANAIAIKDGEARR